MIPGMKYGITEMSDVYCGITDRFLYKETIPRPDLGTFEDLASAFLTADQESRAAGPESNFIVVDETGAQAIPELPPMEALHGMEGLEDFEV
jgi:hypothetical protein